MRAEDGKNFEIMEDGKMFGIVEDGLDGMVWMETVEDGVVYGVLLSLELVQIGLEVTEVFIIPLDGFIIITHDQ